MFTFNCQIEYKKREKNIKKSIFGLVANYQIEHYKGKIEH